MTLQEYTPREENKTEGQHTTISKFKPLQEKSPSVLLLSFDNALIRFKQILNRSNKGYNQNNFYLNNKRYATMQIEGEKCLIVFKRDFFLTYANYYPNEESKLGETINRDDLREAIGGEGVTRLIYLYEDGRIYTAKIANLLNHWHLRTTSAEDKEQYCFNIKHLNRWE